MVQLASLAPLLMTLQAPDTVVVHADGPPKWGENPRVVEEVRIGQLEGPEEYALGARSRRMGEDPHLGPVPRTKPFIRHLFVDDDARIRVAVLDEEYDAPPAGDRGMRRLIGTVLIVLVALSAVLLSACEGPERTVQATPATRDSSGIEIVTTPDDAEAFRSIGTVSDEPELVLGEVEGEGPELFGSSLSVRSLPDGSIVIADRQADDIRVFTHEGRYLRAIGSRGRGPGEFQGLAAIVAATHDSLWAWDSTLRRLTIFEVSGSFARSVDLNTPSHMMPLSVSEDGVLILTSRLREPGTLPTPTDGRELQRDSMVLTRHDPSGALIDTVAVLPAHETLRTVTSPNPNSYQIDETTPPFWRDAYLSARAGGVVGGPNDTFQLSWWTDDGTLRRVTRVPALTRPLNAEDVEKVKVRFRPADDAPPQARRAAEALFSDYPLPAYRPAFSDVMASTDGVVVWVREFELWVHDRPWWWAVDGVTGRLEGYVEFPPELDVQEVGPDYVLGVRHDSLGVAYVQRYVLTLR